jgi:hypothetical protein
MLLPGRFLPRNKLMNFYLSQKDTMRAKFEALEIKKMKIKIPSTLVEKIRMNADKVLTY